MKILLALLLLPTLALADLPDRRFGGCTDDHEVCAGPAAALSVVSHSLETGETVAGLIPGVGYGVTAFADKWYNVGADLFLEVRTGEGPDVFAPAFLLSFAEYLRVGVAFERTSNAGESNTDTRLLLGIGADFGPTPGLGLVDDSP